MSHIAFRVVFTALVALVLTAGPAWAAKPMGGVGIGITVDEDQSVWVDTVVPGGPADQAGIQEGDEVIAIDGRDVEGISPTRIPELIRGPVGSTVTLRVVDEDDAERDVKLRRAAMRMDTGEMLGEPAPAEDENVQPAEPQVAAPPAAAKAEHAPASSAKERAAARPGTLSFSRLSVKDPGINNIEAVSLLIPSGWKTDGGIQWFPDYSILANLLMTITDPQTGAQIEFLPVQNFTWLQQMVVPMQPGTNYLGNILHQPVRDARQFIEMFYVPHSLAHLGNARVVGEENLPKIASAVSRALGGQSQVKSTRVRYQYTRNGRPWQEDVYVTLVYTDWQLGTMWSVYSACALRAPESDFERLAPVMSTSVSTLRLSPEWYSGYRYVSKLFEDRMRQGIRDAGTISDTITRNGEEIRKMYSDAYREQQASQDRISREFSEAIRGVETYSNPYEDRPVELPSGYDDAWVNARGEYLLSNDANYNPNEGDTTEWRRMQPKP